MTIESRIVPAETPGVIEDAARRLARGELIVIPTDTVYGVAAAIDRPDAVARLYVAKDRPLDRPIPVLISDFEQIARLTSGFDPRLEPLLRRYWPGGLTVALPAAPWLPEEIVRDTGRVGLRMPDHPVSRAIIRKAGGAIATTSANRSGEPAATTAIEAAAALGGRVSLVVDAGESPGGVSSTVIVVDGDRVTVVRRGAIDPSELPRDLGDIQGSR